MQQQIDSLAQNMAELQTQHDKDQLLIQKLQNDKDVLLHKVNILQHNMTEVNTKQENDTLTMDNLQHDRDVLREEVSSLKGNNSVLKLLYEDNLQQLLAIKASHVNLQRELKAMSLSVVDGHTEIARINNTFLSQVEHVNKSIRNKISQLVDMDQVLTGNLSAVETYIERGKFTYIFKRKDNLYYYMISIHCQVESRWRTDQIARGR